MRHTQEQTVLYETAFLLKDAVQVSSGVSFPCQTVC
jgi:hypothetical protein